MGMRTKNTLLKSFMRTLDRNGDHIILGQKRNGIWEETNRRELFEMINAGIRVLKDKGVEKGDRVVYKGKNSVEWVAWNMSCYALEAIWVPMYHNQNQKYCDYIVHDCAPKVMITDTDIHVDTNNNNQHIKLQYPNVNLLSTELVGEKQEATFGLGNGDELATLIYTSGTTGNPKGVMLSHHNILSNVDSIHHRFIDAPQSTSLNILPWAHIYGLTCEMYYNLMYDNCTMISSSKDEFIRECREVKPDVLYIVPKVLENVKGRVEFFNHPYLNHLFMPRIMDYLFGGNVHSVYMGGAKLDETTKRFFLRHGLNICEGYGCTETAPMVCVNHQTNPRNTDSVGKILDGVHISIIDGEIHVAGDNVMRSYWNNQEATDDVLVSHDGKMWYKTGDSGSIEDGFLYYNGRISENYKLTNGKFVHVQQVEGVVRKHVAHNVVVFGENQKHNILISDGTISPQIMETINRELESYLRIKDVIVIHPEKMQEFMTPKMSIKRKPLIEHAQTMMK